MLSTFQPFPLPHSQTLRLLTHFGQEPQNNHVSADCEKTGRPHEAPHHSHLLRLTLSPISSFALARAVSQHMMPTRAPRLHQNIAMCWTVMWGFFPPAVILSFLYSSTHLPEMEMNPLKMVCVCLYHTWQGNKYFKTTITHAILSPCVMHASMYNCFNWVTP